MKSCGWALIPYDWCPYEKRRLGPRNTQINYQVRAQREDSHLNAKERGLGRKQPCRHLELRLPASSTGEK